MYETYKPQAMADGDLLLDDDHARDDRFLSDRRFFGAVDIIITGEVRPCRSPDDMQSLMDGNDRRATIVARHGARTSTLGVSGLPMV